MTKSELDALNNAAQQEVQQIIQEKVSRARKEEVLDVYQDLLQTIWDRILPTLGRVTVMTIVERSLALTQESYPSVAHLAVTPNGLSFEQLHRNLDDRERETLRDALQELVANLIDILAMLTGDILVRQLIHEMEGKGVAP